MKATVLYMLLALAMLASCADSYETQQRIDKQRREELRREDSLSLKVAVVPSLDCLPLYVAKERRLFDTLGVDVHLKIFKAAIDADVALREGYVEGAVSDLVRTERIARQGVAMNYVSTTIAGWQLLANRKSRVKALNQLGDKMLAMTRYSALDYLTEENLNGVKTKAQVFRIQINDPQIRLRMLLNNELDAVWLAEPYATMAREANNPVLADSRDKFVSLGVVAFRSKSMEDKRRKQQLQLFIKAYNMACDSINTRGFDTYASIFEKYYDVHSAALKKLPKTKFLHASAPRKEDIDKASAFAATTLKSTDR